MYAEYNNANSSLINDNSKHIDTLARGSDVNLQIHFDTQSCLFFSNYLGILIKKSSARYSIFLSIHKTTIHPLF